MAEDVKLSLRAVGRVTMTPAVTTLVLAARTAPTPTLALETAPEVSLVLSLAVAV